MFKQWVDRNRSTAAAAGMVGIVGILMLAMVIGSAQGPTGPTPVPSGVGRSSPVPSAEGAETVWLPLTLAAYQPVAELIPTEAGGTTIGAGTSFTLRSRTAAPALELAAGLLVHPPVELVVEPGPSADLAVVRPASPLARGARYSFELTDPNGTLLTEWTFRTGGPLHVTSLLPGDQSSQVPLDTGIEIEFDQDGVADLEGNFSIEPDVPGRLERHGRTWVFVPGQDLLPSTLYTVTVEQGVGIEGSDEVLEETVTAQFETTGPQPTEPMVLFGSAVREVLPGEMPVLPAEVFDPRGEETNVLTASVDLYRLTTVEQAAEAIAALSADIGWARSSSTGNVPLDGLTSVASAEAELSGDWRGHQLSIPVELDAGWYLVNVAQDGRDGQLVLQASDVAVYAVASESRTVAWVNDLGTDRPIAGAGVSILGGPSIGRTDASGVMDVATPGALLAEGQPSRLGSLLVEVADGRRLIAPLGHEAAFWRDDSRSRWWMAFGTDREQYRSDDTIHAWGVLRSRDDRAAAGTVELRLTAGDGETGPALVRTSVPTTVRGTFSAELPFTDLPLGGYRVVLAANGEVVSTAYVTVAEIRKPAFRIEVATERRVYVHGDTVRGQASAAFYDGTAAPGMRLRMTGYDGEADREQVVTADRTGIAELTFRASAAGGLPNQGHVGASPAQAEEGTSTGHAEFAVLPSTAWLVAQSTLDGRTLRVNGEVTAVDFAEAESQMAAMGWIEDPSGEPLAGRRVSIEVLRSTWVARRIATTYDFVLKRTVPNYAYDEVVDEIGTFAAVSGSDGAFALTVPDLPPTGSYEVRLAVTDAQNRVMRANAWVQDALSGRTPSSMPYLESQGGGCGYPYGVTRLAELAEQVTLTLREGDGSTSPAAPTLYVSARLGIDQALVSSESTYTHAFGDADLPNLTVRAVRVMPAGLLVTNDVGISLADGEKDIDVSLDPDRSVYQPGDEASVGITTAGPDGSPLAADVLVRVIDTKLYAVGAARELDAGGLMASVSSGLMASYASHRIPLSLRDGCGATSGGGGDEPREDFEDLATFQMIQTDASGRGSVSFTLPDDITSWEVAAAAFADGLESGTSAVELPASLDFFVDSVVGTTYLAGETAALQLRAYGDALDPGDAVRFTVTARSLGIASATADAAAFEVASLELGKLPLGDHELTIAAQRIGSDDLSDEVVRTIRVVPTRLRTLVSAFDPLTDDLDLGGGDGMTTYIISDAGRGGLLTALHALAGGSSARLDASLAAEVARSILVEEFGVEPTVLPASGFNVDRVYQDGLALFPYASPSLFLTARAALAVPGELPRERMAFMLREWADEPGVTREARVVALAGLAGLGENVLGELRGIGRDGLTVDERLWLGLGLAAAGDEEAARSIERDLLAERGMRHGDWVRIGGGTSADSYEASALALLLAARLRDPVALDLSRYLIDNPSREHIAALEQLGFVNEALRWLPRQVARFAWSVDGERREETLEPGGSFRLVLTAAQRESLVLLPLDGAMIVASSWDGPASYDSLPDDPLVTIERTVTPEAAVNVGQMVQVRLDVTIDADAPNGCYEVTDLLPSGLAPVVATWDYYTDADTRQFIPPYSVDGQRVSWCVDPEAPRKPLGYTARIVTPGTYRWEPAVIQSLQDPAIGSATELATYTIR